MRLCSRIRYIVCSCVLIAVAGCSRGKSGVSTQLPGPTFNSGYAHNTPRPIPRQPKTVFPKRQRSYADNTPSQWYPPTAERSWKAIVIHHSADEYGGAKKYDRAHRDRGWDELGYNFVIGNGSATPDGCVEVGPRWRKQKQGAHCKTPNNFYNEYGIGICLVGNFENHRPTTRQMAALKKLVVFLMNRYDIPSNRVYGHGDIGHTKCPGRRMSIAGLRIWAQAKTQVSAGQR